MNIAVKSPNATRTLSEYTAKLSLADVPEAVIKQAKVILSDEVAILLMASTRPSMHTALKAMPISGVGNCTVIGHGTGATPDHAAFINGIGGHDIELDDSHSPSRTHAASVIVPAALVAAETNPNATGADLLAGIIAAYDVQCRVSKAMGVQQQFDRGFHPTVVCGSIGAAVAASRLMRLSDEIIPYAIGLATSQSCGLVTFEDDSSHMLKSFHTGVGARNGMTAALLASAGYKSSPDALSGRHNVLTAFGGDTADFAPLTDKLGSYYEVMGTSIKRHACCGQTHSSVDALLTILEQNNLSAGDIEKIDVQLAHKAVPIINGNPLWTHNIQYVLALAAHERYIGVFHFSPEWTSRPDIAALASKVTVSGNDVLQSRFPSKKGAIVSVTAKGKTVTLEVESPVGNPNNPLSAADLRGKFNGLAEAVLDKADTDKLWTLLADIDKAPSLGDLFAFLRKTPRK